MDESSSSISDLEQEWRCDNVKFEGKQGCLKMTKDKLQFESFSWRLSDVQNHSISAVSATLSLQVGGMGESISFQTETLPELVRFRKALVLRLRGLQRNNPPTNMDENEERLAQKDRAERVAAKEREQAQKQTPTVQSKGRNNGSSERSSQSPKRKTDIPTETGSRERSMLQELPPPREGGALRTSMADIHQVSSEELRDDVVAREILELTGSLHPSSLHPSGHSKDHSNHSSSSFSAQSAPEPPAIPEDEPYHPVTQLFEIDRNIKAKSSFYGASSSPLSADDKRRLRDGENVTSSADDKRRLRDGEITTTSSSDDLCRGMNYVQESLSNVQMQTSTASIVSTDAPQVRGPGAYFRQPGEQSRRTCRLSFSLVGQGGECTDRSDSTELDQDRSVWSDEGTRRQHRSRHQPKSSKLFVNNSSTLVTATLVDDPELADARHSCVVPTAVEVDDHKLMNRKTAAIGLLCCCLTIIAVIIVAVVTAMVVGGEEEESEDLAMMHGSETDRVEAFQAIAQHVSSSGMEASNDPNSAPYRACQWISEEDPMRLNPNEESQHDKIIQRYVLALFYFQTTNVRGGWRGCNQPQTGESIACRYKLLESHGVEGVYFDQNMVENSFRWLSSADECQWAGIRCDNGEHVSTIQLGGYGLTGSFPVELVHLPHLMLLDLQQNSLDSTLPPEFGWGARDHNQDQLEVIRLDQNKFTGSIPKEWCLLSEDSLAELNLGGNELTGSLPSCLGDLLELKDFSVLGNQLSGTIPPELSGTKLERFHFAYNDFVGSVPSSICTAESLLELSTDCLDNEFMECSCCTKCCNPTKDACELTELTMAERGDTLWQP